MTDGASGQATGFRVSSAARFGRTELVLRRERATTATFAGVVTDSTNRPITNAEVMLPDLGKGTGTNEQGAFVLRDIPAGSQRVLVRDVGYGPVETQLSFVGGQTTQRHIVMVRSTTLDSVVVTEKSTDHALDDFEANRKVGLGHFLTRAELAPQEGRSTAAVLTSLPGIKVYTMGSHGWVGSSRHNATSFERERFRPVGVGQERLAEVCAALGVLRPRLSGQLRDLARPEVHVHRAAFGRGTRSGSRCSTSTQSRSPASRPSSITPRAAETPMKYAALNSPCGVLVIHTLRYHSKDTTSASPEAAGARPISMKGREIVVTLVIALVPRVVAAQTIRGTIVDSVSGKGVVHARVSVSGTTLQATADSLGRFTIAGVPSGDQVLAIHTPSLDSLNAGYSAPVTVSSGTTNVAVRVPSALQIAASACGGLRLRRGRCPVRQASGRGRFDRSALGHRERRMGRGHASVECGGNAGRFTWASATADPRGRFALCGVPLDTVLTLKALTDRASGQAGNVRVPASARFARTEIVLRKEVATTGILAGIVTDSANAPIGGVEVSLPDVSKTTLTNEQGAFALRDVPPGAHHLSVRRVGYGPVEAQVAIEAGRTVERRIRLVRATSLDSVVVTEKAVDHQLDDFEVNKKLGLGHFLTRAELAPQEGRSTGAVLTLDARHQGVRHRAVRMGGIRASQRDFPRERRRPIGRDGCQRSERRFGIAMRSSSWTIISSFVGRNSGYPPRWEPLFDINSIPVSEIEAIEYYASAAQTPMKYSVLNSQCGVVVIHTLRYHPADTTAAAKKPPGR